jgi:hypothetical protein
VLDENPYSALGDAPKKEDEKKAMNSKSKNIYNDYSI